MQIHTKAVLLDMDGTLVQSTDEVELVWRHWCNTEGVPLDAVLAICHGVRSRDVVQRVAPHLDIEAQIGVLEDLEIRLATNAKALSGARSFLEALRLHPCAVVTSASQKVARHRLASCDLPIPDMVIGSDNVAYGKPHPEPYLSAAQRLAQDPRDCLAFEDAKAGIESALAAGCRVVQVGSGKAMCPGVLAVIHDWREVKVDAGVGGLVITVPDRFRSSRA
jgi:mannitol-1-/sugar-/sorbitol-6-phosphatase